jgi:hypothetical protein
LESNKPLPPASPLKQQSHRHRIAVVIIIEARYRRSVCIVISSYCRRRIVIVVMWLWALLHCRLAADATIKSSSPIAELASYHGRIVVVMIWSPNATIKSSLPCQRRGVIVLSSSMYRRCDDAEPAYPCHPSPQITTIKSSSPHRHSTIMVVLTSYRCHHDLELKYNNQILIAVSTLMYMTHVNFVYESSCSLFNMETIRPMAVINISQQSATKEGGGDDKSGVQC